MATGAEPSPATGANSSTTSLTLEDALQQARLLHDTFRDSFDDQIERSRSRLAQILSTSSSHLRYTLDSLEDIRQDYAAYENVFFGKIKEGVDIAASHPLSTTGAVAGFGLTALKRPRCFLYYKTLHL